jgi:hypothetical protein
MTPQALPKIAIMVNDEAVRLSKALGYREPK